MTRTFGPLAGAAFYLLLIDTTSLPELYAGAGAVAIAAAVHEVARRQRIAEAVIRPVWLRRGWRLLWAIPAQSTIVAAEAILQLGRRSPHRGALRTTPFRCTGGEGHDLGRRALAEGVGSLAPNTIVIGVDSERELLLVHQLRVSGDADALDVLGLG